MDTTESLGYLKGLIEGLDLGDNKKETKVFSAIVDVLSNLVEDIDDMTDGVEMLADQVDTIVNEKIILNKEKTLRNMYTTITTTSAIATIAATTMRRNLRLNVLFATLLSQ